MPCFADLACNYDRADTDPACEDTASGASGSTERHSHRGPSDTAAPDAGHGSR